MIYLTPLQMSANKTTLASNQKKLLGRDVCDLLHCQNCISNLRNSCTFDKLPSIGQCCFYDSVMAFILSFIKPSGNSVCN